MLNLPEVSVIMPSHNDALHLKEAVASVVAQTHTDWEIRLVDDGSNAAMAAQIRTLVAQYQAQGYAIHLHRHAKAQGAASARNTAIHAAKGRYIAFLDADDTWLPEKLAEQTRFMRQHQTAFSYTAYEQRLNNSVTGESQPLATVSAPQRLTHQDLLKGCVVGCLTVMYDSHQIGKRYMPQLPCSQDYALWLAILREHPEGRGLNKVLARYTRRPGSLSSNKWRKVKYHWMICRQQEHLSYWQSVLSLVQCTGHSLIKRYRRR